MAEIIDEKGKINYQLALNNLKAFLYGRKGRIDPNIHLKDLHFYRRNFRLVLRSLSLPLFYKILSLWQVLGYRILHQYFQLNVIGIINKLKERELTQRASNER
ncbi:MAG TPA: hypothetical protein VMV49_17805 [Candidatus Deferrimicrobium sp.]|nr:hypothetical protein [Candidatus Deferrimicrobium sp.]